MFCVHIFRLGFRSIRNTEESSGEMVTLELENTENQQNVANFCYGKFIFYRNAHTIINY